MKAKFNALHTEYDEVFNPNFKGYNGFVGPFTSVVNMGPVQPPQRKGRIPQYSRDKLTELQAKFDELEQNNNNNNNNNRMSASTLNISTHHSL